MADLNYINPTALKPEIGWAPKNALSGLMYMQNDQDYRQAFDQQMRLQAMGEQERQLDLEEKRANVPLKDLEREGKMEGFRGSNPYARNLASSGARAGIAQNEINASDEARRAKLREFAAKIEDSDYQKYGRSLDAMSGILAPAMQMVKADGMAGSQRAVDFVKQQVEQARKTGLDIPDAILDPNNWPALYDAAIEIPKYRQEMRRVKEEGLNAQDVAEIRGGYGLQEARERSASNERIAGINVEGRDRVAQARTQNQILKLSTDQNVNKLVNEIANAPEGVDVSSKGRELEASLAREYDLKNAQMSAILGKSDEGKKMFQNAKKTYVEDKMKTLFPNYSYQESGSKSNSIPGTYPEAKKKKYGLE